MVVAAKTDVVVAAVNEARVESIADSIRGFLNKEWGCEESRNEGRGKMTICLFVGRYTRQTDMDGGRLARLTIKWC